MSGAGSCNLRLAVHARASQLHAELRAGAFAPAVMIDNINLLANGRAMSIITPQRREQFKFGTCNQDFMKVVSVALL